MAYIQEYNCNKKELKYTSAGTLVFQNLMFKTERFNYLSEKITSLLGISESLDFLTQFILLNVDQAVIVDNKVQHLPLDLCFSSIAFKLYF